jgi:hypothetical protein
MTFYSSWRGPFEQAEYIEETRGLKLYIYLVERRGFSWAKDGVAIQCGSTSKGGPIYVPRNWVLA